MRKRCLEPNTDADCRKHSLWSVRPCLSWLSCHQQAHIPVRARNISGLANIGILAFVIASTCGMCQPATDVQCLKYLLLCSKSTWQGRTPTLIGTHCDQQLAAFTTDSYCRQNKSRKPLLQPQPSKMFKWAHPLACPSATPWTSSRPMCRCCLKPRLANSHAHWAP